MNIKIPLEWLKKGIKIRMRPKAKADSEPGFDAQEELRRQLSEKPSPALRASITDADPFVRAMVRLLTKRLRKMTPT